MHSKGFLVLVIETLVRGIALNLLDNFYPLMMEDAFINWGIQSQLFLVSLLMPVS